jgi:hypothetical protein
MPPVEVTGARFASVEFMLSSGADNQLPLNQKKENSRRAGSISGLGSFGSHALDGQYPKAIRS